MTYSLWWDHLTPKAQPLPCCPHHAPHPQRKHSGPCDICSGHHRAIFPLPWQLAEQARPLTASGGGRKGPQCQVARPAAPPVSSRQWGQAMSAVTRGGHRDPPSRCVHCTDGMEPRSRSLVSALSGRPEKDKAGWVLQSGLASSFTLSCSELKSFVVFGFEIQGVTLYSLSHNGCELRWA